MAALPEAAMVQLLINLNVLAQLPDAEAREAREARQAAQAQAQAQAQAIIPELGISADFYSGGLTNHAMGGKNGRDECKKCRKERNKCREDCNKSPDECNGGQWSDHRGPLRRGTSPERCAKFWGQSLCKAAQWQGNGSRGSRSNAIILPMGG